VFDDYRAVAIEEDAGPRLCVSLGVHQPAPSPHLVPPYRG
jgi:hypothetical protein